MLVTFLVFASIIVGFLLSFLIYNYLGKKNITSAPGIDASDEKLGNFPDIQVSINGFTNKINAILLIFLCVLPTNSI